MAENNAPNEGLEGRINYDTPPATELLMAAHEMFERFSKNVGDLTERLAGMMTPHDKEMFSKITSDAEQQMRERISDALQKRPDIENYPPLVVQFYLAALPILTKEGYVLEVLEGDWNRNPNYHVLIITALRFDRALSDPPIEATFIYHKRSQRLATREAILQASSTYMPDYGQLLDFANTQIYGLEFVLENFFNTPDPDGLAVLRAIKGTDLGKFLTERNTVSRDWRDYGCERRIFYLPQTHAELKDAIPAPYDEHPRNSIIRELER